MTHTTEIPQIVCQIVDRCHVGQPDSKVIRYFISRLKRKYRTWRTLSRAERKQWMTWVIARHRENRSVYRAAMSGRG